MRDQERDLRLLAIAFFDNLQIDNVEYGGIGIDDKRPFGNSDVEGDMLEIIGLEPGKDAWSEEQREYVANLYNTKLIPWLQANCRPKDIS